MQGGSVQRRGVWTWFRWEEQLGTRMGHLGGWREHLGGAKTCFGAFLGTPGGWGGFVEARGSIPEQKPEIGKKNSTNNIGMLFPCCLLLWSLLDYRGPFGTVDCLNQEFIQGGEGFHLQLPVLQGGAVVSVGAVILHSILGLALTHFPDLHHLP